MGHSVKKQDQLHYIQHWMNKGSFGYASEVAAVELLATVIPVNRHVIPVTL